MTDLELPREVELVLAYVGAWAPAEPSIAALALIGAHARGGAGTECAIGLLLLSDDPPDQPWPDDLSAVEVLEAGRVRLPDGLLLEIVVAPSSWAGVDPVDHATRSVVEAGLVVLHDPVDLLADLLLALR